MEEQVNIPALLQFFDGETFDENFDVIWLWTFICWVCSVGKSALLKHLADEQTNASAAVNQSGHWT